jgi:hypothetical protein
MRRRFANTAARDMKQKPGYKWSQSGVTIAVATASGLAYGCAWAFMVTFLLLAIVAVVLI